MLYDEERMSITKERLEDLRKEKKLSFEQLSKALAERGTYISHTNLMYYEINDPEHKLYHRTRSMNIEYLVAFADFYDVSLEYLLGLSDSRKREYIDIAEQLHLRDEAIDNLIALREEDMEDIENADLVHGKAMTVVNDMLCDPEILSALRDIAMAELTYRRAKFFESESIKEMMEKDDELRRAIEKINEYDIFTVRYGTVVDIFVQKAIDKMNAFIRKYPEVGYIAAQRRLMEEE